MECNLGNSINPFILIKASAGAQGWKKPQATVIDWNPIKHPAKSVLAINQTSLAIKVYFTKKGTVIGPGEYRHFKVKLNSESVFRYKVEISDGKSKLTVSNSQYRLNQKNRLIMVALPAPKAKLKIGKIPRPSLRMISDSL